MTRLKDPLKRDRRPLGGATHRGLGSLEAAEDDLILGHEQRAEVANDLPACGELGGGGRGAIVESAEIRLAHTGPEALGQILGPVDMLHTDKVGRDRAPVKQGKPYAPPGTTLDVHRRTRQAVRSRCLLTMERPRRIAGMVGVAGGGTLMVGQVRCTASSGARGEAMQITRNMGETGTGPSEWFTGAVYLDPVAVPMHGYRISASSVHFTPGARTAWHTHPNGQTIYVTEGMGRVQRRGGEVEVIRPGDRVFFEPAEDHWHGATPTRFMTHLSLVEVDEAGNSATWGAHVSDEEYRASTSLDGEER